MNGQFLGRGIVVVVVWLTTRKKNKWKCGKSEREEGREGGRKGGRERKRRD